MSRFHRFREDNRPFFVTTSTLRRQRIFTDTRNAELMMSVLYYARQNYSFRLLSFVIMPDHLHAIIVPAPRNDISQVMRYIKGRHARLHNQAHNKSGAVWQDSFHDHGIRDDGSLWQLVRYIEENPVVDGLTSNAAEYRFSSANALHPTDLAAYLGQGESLTHDWRVA
jgi:putative transposase